MGLLNEIAERLLKKFLSLKEDDWIEWIAQPNDWQDDCDKFNGCYFIVKPIPNITAKATCDIRKFTGYIFDEEKNKGKKKLFESWGYTIVDSEYLQQLYISQAIQKYCDGKYQYAGVNDYGAKISIVITLPNQDGVEQHINTIWKLGQKGNIDLATPYSGHSY